MTTQMLFSQVAKQFVDGLDTAYAHRSSDRLSDNTRRLYSRYATRAAESLGSVPLAGLNATHVRNYIAELKSEGLAPATISGCYQVLKAIAQFVRDDSGEPVIQRKWNLDFIGLPVIQTEQQNTPCATAADVEKAISAGGEIGKLVALLAGTGLRISEALSLVLRGEGANFYDPQTSTIRVSEGKTNSAARTIVLTAELNRYLAVGNGGRLFKMSLPSVYDKLNALGLPPCHSYRRFRATRCRSMGMIESILKAQLGHSKRGDITSVYDRSAENFELVRNEVERCGLGFSTAGRMS